MKRDLTIKISKNGIMYFLTIIPYVPIAFISDHFSPWSSFCSYARILIIVFYLIRLAYNRRKISIPFILAIILFGSSLFSSLIIGNSLGLTFYNIVYLFGVILIIEDGLFTDKTSLIYGLLVYFEILVYLNLIYFIFFPQGYYNSAGVVQHFLGNYNTSVKYLMPGIPLGVLRAFREKGRVTIRLCLMLVSMLIFFASEGALTNTIALVICFLGLFYYSFRNKIGIFRYEIFLVVSIVLTFIFAITGRFLSFSNLIVNVFNKDMTLSNRTYIWERTISYISQRPIWGYGQSNSELNILRLGQQGAHNLYLDFLYNGGIVGLLILTVILLVVGMKLFQCRKKYPTIAVAFDSTFCAYFIMCTFNLFGSFNNFYFLYAVLVFAYHCDELVPWFYKSSQFSNLFKTERDVKSFCA